MVRDRVVQLRKSDGEDTQGDSEAADELCRAFRGVLQAEPPLNDDFESTVQQPDGNDGPSDPLFTEERLLQKLKKLMDSIRTC